MSDGDGLPPTRQQIHYRVTAMSSTEKTGHPRWKVGSDRLPLELHRRGGGAQHHGLMDAPLLPSYGAQWCPGKALNLGAEDLPYDC